SLEALQGQPQASREVAGLSAEKPRLGPVYLVVGPVGAGKTTYALGLARAHQAVRLDLDQWMATLFRQDRPESDVLQWYRERAARSREQIWHIARSIAEVGSGVVLELGLLQRRQREQFYARVARSGFDLKIYAVEAAREVRRQRVRERNRTRGATFSMVVPSEIFELASDSWEPLEPSECEAYSVRIVRTDDS